MDLATAQGSARRGDSLCPRRSGDPAVNEGDGVGLTVDGDQGWFFTPERLAGKREADEEIAMSRGTVHVSGEAMFVYLENLGAADG